jgi:hypothetical protein
MFHRTHNFPTPNHYTNSNTYILMELGLGNCSSSSLNIGIDPTESITKSEKNIVKQSNHHQKLDHDTRILE